VGGVNLFLLGNKNLTIDEDKDIILHHDIKSGIFQSILNRGKYTAEQVDELFPEYLKKDKLEIPYHPDAKGISFKNIYYSQYTIAGNASELFLEKYMMQLNFEIMRYCCCNKLITLDFLSKYKIIINYSYLSYNPNINIKYILENKNKYWNWSVLSYNTGISLEDIYDTWDILQWDHISLLQRHDITISFIEFVLNKIKYSYSRIEFLNQVIILLVNPAFSFSELNKIMQIHIGENWINNKKIDLEDVYIHLSTNESITYEDIISLDIDQLNWHQLSINKFECSSKHNEIRLHKEKRNRNIEYVTEKLNEYIPDVLSRIISSYVYFI
jgi:hypothetical protein